jgi:CMP/dCMP kinase
VKLYLDASAEERARRRASDPAHSGPAALSEVATLLSERDRSDSTRAASPLYAAEDAIIIDTTNAPIGHVVAQVMTLVRAKLADELEE